MNRSFIYALIVGIILLVWAATCFSQPAPTPVLSQASDIETTTSAFNSNLSAADNTVQKALDTLDNLVSGGGAWGTITGTLSNQTDLQAALDAKISSQWATQSSVNVSLAGGNVGIGTITTGARLQLRSPASDGAAQSIVITPAASTTAMVLVDEPVANKPRVRMRDASASTVILIQLDASGNSFINTGNVGIGTNVPFSLFEAGVRKFNITSAGNVGIGSHIPINTLDVNGGGRFQAGLDNSFGSNVGIGTTAPQNPLAVVGAVGIGTIGNSNFVKTVLPSSVMAIEQNVGIGTWKPSKPLVIKGGDVWIDQTSGKLMFVTADGTCSACGPDDSDAFSCAGVACPAR